MTTQASKQPSEQLSVRALLEIIWDGKILAFCVLTISVLLSIVVAWKSPVMYQSVSKMVTKTNESGSSSKYSQIAAIAGLNAGVYGSSDPALYLSDVIWDREFISKILFRKWFYKGDSAYLHGIWELKPDTVLPDWKNVYEKEQIDIFRNGGFVSLGINEQNGVMTLMTQFSDPALAFQVNEYVIGLIEEYFQDRLKSQTRENRIFIQKRIREVQGELQNSEDALAKYREKNLGGAAPKVALQEQRLLRDVNINQEVYLQLRKEYELARIEEMKNTPIVEVISSPEVPIYRFAPKRRTILSIGLISGLLAGILAVLAWNWIRDEFHHGKNI